MPISSPHTSTSSPNTIPIPPHQHLSGMQGLPSPTSSVQHGWRSILRIGSQSSKKIGNLSTLTLETDALSSEPTSATLTPMTPIHTLTPGSIMSIDQRSSYNSSNTLSSDSINGAHRPVPMRAPSTPSYFSPHLGEAHPAVNHEHDKARSKSKSKSDKQRMLGQFHKESQTANPSQVSFNQQTPSHSSRAGPLSPKAISAGASRFIRRVASAPNAKGLFSLGSHRSTPPTTTRNGLLSPGDALLPILHIEDGADSLETISSSSSRGRPPRQARANSATSNGRTKDKITSPQSSAEGPGKVAFRRTYSSHSIKVKQVGPRLSNTMPHHLTYL